jgi:(p)ppGpp synthase/HD superfamily hydrolase
MELVRSLQLHLVIQDGRDENMPQDNLKKLYLSRRFTDAVDYVRQLHIECRKGTEIPYMAHLLGVASLVMGENGYVSFPVTEDMVIAALLHDAAEDHGGEPRIDDIKRNFGERVAGMVRGLSDSFVEDASQKRPWPERKKAYVESLRREPPEVKLISIADKLYNARAILDDYRIIGQEIWKRFKRGREDQLWYFDELLKVFAESRLGRIVDEFARVLAELKEISKVEGQ